MRNCEQRFSVTESDAYIHKNLSVKYYYYKEHVIKTFSIKNMTQYQSNGTIIPMNFNGLYSSESSNKFSQAPKYHMSVYNCIRQLKLMACDNLA